MTETCEHEMHFVDWECGCEIAICFKCGYKDPLIGSVCGCKQEEE